MKMMKNRIVMIMIILGMIIILITLTVVIVLLAIVARNEKLAINLTVLIKSINGVARGNVKKKCVRVIFLVIYIYIYIYIYI